LKFNIFIHKRLSFEDYISIAKILCFPKHLKIIKNFYLHEYLIGKYLHYFHFRKVGKIIVRKILICFSRFLDGK
jgi:hypothetical protein